EVYPDVAGPPGERGLRLGRFRGRAADAGFQDFRGNRLEVGEEPDTAVPDGERLERIAQVMQAAVEVSQLGRELTIFCLQAAGAGEVHRTGETGVSKEQADTDGDDREPGNQLDRGVGNLDDTRGLRIMRDENNGPSASCHRHSPGLG